ncbi:DNA polymerase I [Candidatus Sumerlaeota bacterium]|nr:DNA polymerase I [Candidatus Sumerlaeota bacterium]
MADQKRLYLIDGHSQIYKAFYAIRNLSNSQGTPVNMVFGFSQILQRVLKEFEPEYIAVIFDSPGKTFRNEIYADYKANRQAPPEDLSAQIPLVMRMLDAFGVPRMAREGFEADDLLATLAREGAQQGCEVYIISSDKDLFQLVNERVKVINIQNDKFTIIGADEVKEKMGVPPEQMLDLQGLTGDPVDNIPGVPKVGPKTALKLLEQFGSLDAVLERAEEITSKALRERIIEHAEQARISRHLAALDDSVELELGPEELIRGAEDRAELARFFAEMEFRQWMRQYPLEGELPPEEAAQIGPSVFDTRHYEIVDSEKALKRWVERLHCDKSLAFDTETDGLDPFSCPLVGISLCNEPGHAIYIPVGHATLSEDQLELKQVCVALGPVMADPKTPKAAHNASFDLKTLERHGMPVRGLVFDTMIAAFLLESDRRIGLKALARELLNIQMTEIEELIGSGKNQCNMSDVEIQRAGMYACQDADATLRLMQLLKPAIDSSPMQELFYDIEMPLIEVIHRMEVEGVRIDAEHFKRLSQEFQAELEKLAEAIYKECGRTFTINSPKQVGEILFDELKLSTQGVKKGKTGAYSTDVSVLEKLKHEHPLPAMLLEYRKFEKLKSTYVDPLPTMRNRKTGRLHTQFSQTGAATGRLSSSHPNLQNIPVRREEGRKIRRGFLPSALGRVLLAADYSQIELRVLAHMSQDATLIDAFRQGDDIHALTAQKIFGVGADKQDKAMRSQAKVVNFGIIYGMSAFRLSNELEIPRDRAAQFIEEYFKAYPGVQAWTEQIVEQAREQGWVETLTRRRRYLRDIHSRNHNLRAQAERIAVNTPIQGTAADMIKLAMVKMDAALGDYAAECKMILQVHDELIFDLPESAVDACKPLIVAAMENALPLDVPVKVDVAVGANWEEV